MKRKIILLSILNCFNLNAQVSVYDCNAIDAIVTQVELDVISDYYRNCVILPENEDFNFNGDDVNSISATNFINIKGNFHAGPYNTDGKMHLHIAPPTLFDVAVMNYSNLEWINKLEKLEFGIVLPIDIEDKIQNFIENNSEEKLNPFLEWEVRVYAEFFNFAHSPEPIVIDGFYTQNYDSWMLNMDEIPDITGQQSCTDEMYESYGGYEKSETPYPFLLRFAPPFTGDYFGRVYIEINGVIHSSSNLFTFHVVESGNPGYLSIGENKRYLKKGNNTFYPIGLNMSWPETNEFTDPIFANKIKVWNNDIQESVVINSGYRQKYESPRSYDNFKDVIGHFSDSGVNLIRMIMSPNSNEIEWEELGNYSNRLHMAQELDEIIDYCEFKNVYLIWNFQIHFVLQKSIDAYYRNWTWDRENQGVSYCYKTLVEESGPFLPNENEPLRFFSDEEAKKYYKQRLRYILARWGYSTNIGMFELFSEINNSGFQPAFYTNNLENYNWELFRDWQLEMADYVKSFHNGKSHLLTTSFAGKKNQQDNVFLSDNIDLMSSNDYDFKEPNFNSFLIKSLSELKLNESDEVNDSYTLNNGDIWQRNIKPMIFSEMGTNEVDGNCRNVSNTIEMNRSQWQSLFSGLAGGFSWEGYFHLNNSAIYAQNNQFISGHDLDGGKWHPGASEQFDATPLGWKYNSKYAKDMVGKNNKADLMYLRSGDRNYAIGVLTNRTYNVYSVADCFDYIWDSLSSSSIPSDERWGPTPLGNPDGVYCGNGAEHEQLKLRGMRSSKYYINYFNPNNLSVPIASTEDWGPRVKFNYTIQGNQNGYITLFMARRRNHDWLPENEPSPTFEEIIRDQKLWENAEWETAVFLDSLNELTNDKIQIYPNPGSSKLHLELPNELLEGYVLVETLNGAKMIEQKIKSLNPIIDVSKLESGVYVVRVLNFGELIFIEKYIKL